MPTDLARFQTFYNGGFYGFRFDNGHEATVAPDRDALFRFRLEVADFLHPFPGLTTEELEAKLAELAALPAKDAR